MTDEEYVREKCETDCVTVFVPTEIAPDYLVQVGDHCYSGETEAKAWAKARVPVEAWLEQIRQVEEECRLIRRQAVVGRDYKAKPQENDDSDRNAWVRILSREQAALAELKKGMK